METSSRNFDSISECSPEADPSSVNRQAIARCVMLFPKLTKLMHIRRCPSLDITLRFAHCRCETAPISVLESEEFPRVRRLILYVGKHDPEETHLRRQDRCAPSAKFFRPLVNGLSFPDLKKLEVRHYWATIPPANASLETGEQGNAYMPQAGCFDSIGHSDGLKKLESIMLESPPELNSAVLMQLVGNPKAMASNLTTLDLRFCELDHDTLAQLVYHAPPKLARFSLFCGYENVQSHDYRFIHSRKETTSTHLCPLIRQFSKRLVHLDFSAAHICRQLFFDEEEIRSLRESGITTKIGGNGGQEVESENLDILAIQQIIRTVRQHKRTTAREARISEALHDLQLSSQPSNPASLFGTASHAANAESRVRREIEISLDEEEEQRHRLVSRSNTKWFRRFIAWQGLCEFGDSWAEMKLAADMEEKGVQWVIASMSQLLPYFRKHLIVG